MQEMFYKKNEASRTGAQHFEKVFLMLATTPTEKIHVTDLEMKKGELVTLVLLR